MYLKSIALLVAIYGRGVLAALPDSCEEGEGSNCADCTPLASDYEPAGVGEVWYSACCTKAEEDNSISPPVTTTKEYCYSYKLKGWPENQSYGTTPSSSSLTCGTGTVEAWTLVGQCTTNGGVSSSATCICIFQFVLFLSRHTDTDDMMSLTRLRCFVVSLSINSLLKLSDG